MLVVLYAVCGAFFCQVSCTVRGVYVCDAVRSVRDVLTDRVGSMALFRFVSFRCSHVPGSTMRGMPSAFVTTPASDTTLYLICSLLRSLQLMIHTALITLCHSRQRVCHSLVSQSHG